MKPLPPQHVVLPVLTERLQLDDAIPEEDVAKPIKCQPSADADGVDCDPAYLLPLAKAGAPAIGLDQLLAHIAPVLQQRLLEQVRAELDAMASQVAAKVFQSLGQTLRACLADALKQQ